jgi:chemotaxis response regulator CheB
MAASDTAGRAGLYAQRLIENEYVQANLAQAAESLRAAYRRASRRRIEPTTDEKIRAQIRQAALSISEAANALKTGRQKPKRRRGRRLVIVAVAVGGAAALLAADEELRKSIFGGGAALEPDPGPPGSSERTAAP